MTLGSFLTSGRMGKSENWRRVNRHQKYKNGENLSAPRSFPDGSVNLKRFTMLRQLHIGSVFPWKFIKKWSFFLVSSLPTSEILAFLKWLLFTFRPYSL